MTLPTDEQQRAWMAQWRAAAPELERIRAAELTGVDLARIAEALEDVSLAAAAIRAQSVTSGLVAQQRIFQRRLPK